MRKSLSILPSPHYRDYAPCYHFATDSLEGPSSCMSTLSGEGSKGTAGPLPDATQGFLGKFTSHTRAARETMKDLSVATVWIGVDDVLELL